MTGRRPAGSRNAAPLWRDENGQQAPTPTPEPHGQPVPSQRGGRRRSEHADRAAGQQTDHAHREPGERRRAADGRSGDGRSGDRSRSASRRSDRRRSAAADTNRIPAVLPALGLPVLGALADEMLGGGLGWIYATCAVLGAGLAALVASRRGRWWVVTGAPVVTLTVAFAVDYLARGDRYQGAGLATQGLQLISGRFWPMVVALVAALLGAAVRARRTRKVQHG